MSEYKKLLFFTFSGAKLHKVLCARPRMLARKRTKHDVFQYGGSI